MVNQVTYTWNKMDSHNILWLIKCRTVGNSKRIYRSVMILQSGRLEEVNPLQVNVH
jgi:hypothetical protein